MFVTAFVCVRGRGAGAWQGGGAGTSSIALRPLHERQYARLQFCRRSSSQYICGLHLLLHLSLPHLVPQPLSFLQGVLLQIFTKPLGDRPTVFFEIIQRLCALPPPQVREWQDGHDASVLSGLQPTPSVPFTG